jgi:hypothetical protein
MARPHAPPPQRHNSWTVVLAVCVLFVLSVLYKENSAASPHNQSIDKLIATTAPSVIYHSPTNAGNQPPPPPPSSVQSSELDAENDRLRAEIEANKQKLEMMKQDVEQTVQQQQAAAEAASSDVASTAAATIPTSGSTSGPTGGTKKTHRGIIFVKTYKTASTTVAMILNSIANDLQLKALHPLDRGWFAENEIKSRADEGNTFDMSFRHLTPVVEYDQLRRIVPDAFLTTIVRNPATKFVSMFNFVESTKKQFGDPVKFVTQGVFGGDATDQQVNDLCNNLAYTLSGERKVLGRMTEEESLEYAQKLIADLEARNVFVMVMERMEESMVVICENMGWDCYSQNHVNMLNTRERSQGGNKVGCEGGCKDVIKTCNYIDDALYKHYNQKLDSITAGVPDFPEKLAKVRENFIQSSNAAHKYPVNCRQEPFTEPWMRLHPCTTR